MTTALKSLYIQIEMPPDANQRATSTTVLDWTIDFSGNADPDRAVGDRRMVFSDEAPVITDRRQRRQLPRRRDGRDGPYNGTSVLFQRLLGLHAALPVPARHAMCDDHPSKPYFTTRTT